MRSYIFTQRERKTINDLLAGKAKLGDQIMRQIVMRTRTFEGLASDVELYLRLRKTITADPT